MLDLLQANASWIVLGVLFLLMMRMHGGGHMHGAQQGGPDEDREAVGGMGGNRSAGMGSSAIGKDPVCEMEVDPKTATATTEYKGKSYYFCSIGCKAAFEMNPEKFGQSQGAGHHRMLAGG